ncbi:MAG: Bug family tripartite tricarboxylate transporter substrate binding protein [Burkholderiales bacterium]
MSSSNAESKLVAMDLLRHICLAMTALVCLGAPCLQQTWAQSYPSKPVQLVVASIPGAATDLVARTLSDRLAERMGAPVVVTNNGGAAGLVAAQALKRAAPDGYSILLATDSLALMMALGTNRDVNVLRDFEMIVLNVVIDFYLAVSGDALGANGAQDLVRLTRTSPGKFSYASPGVGSPHHLAMELFKQQTGADLLHVPYNGIARAVPDLLSGRVQALITGMPAIASQLAGGKIKVLAVAASRRSPERPDTPSLAEAGIPNVELQGYNYALAPQGTPAAIVSRINAEINEVLKNPQVRTELTGRGTQGAGGTPGDLRKKLEGEVDKWTRVVKLAGIKPE